MKKIISIIALLVAMIGIGKDDVRYETELAEAKREILLRRALVNSVQKPTWERDSVWNYIDDWQNGVAPEQRARGNEQTRAAALDHMSRFIDAKKYDSDRLKTSVTNSARKALDTMQKDENLQQIAQLYIETGIRKTELLPYNPTWYGKTEKLGVSVPGELRDVRSWQSSDKIEHCKDIFRSNGIDC